MRIHAYNRIAAALAAIFAASAAHAATWTVDSTADAADRDLADGRCAAPVEGGERCTLRAAVMQAGDGDTIRIASASYALTLGRLEIDSKALEIAGTASGARAMISSRGDRVFDVASSAARGRLELRNVDLDGADALEGSGGAIACAGGALLLADVEIRGSSVTGDGGAIAGDCDAVLRGVELDGNRAGRRGGAIAMLGGANLILEDAGLHGNSAGESGGAIYDETAALTLIGVTALGNESPLGAAVRALDANATIDRTTLAGNGGIDGTDAADALSFHGGTGRLANSVVGGNRATADIDVPSGRLHSEGGNRIGHINHEIAAGTFELAANDAPIREGAALSELVPSNERHAAERTATATCTTCTTRGVGL